MSSGFIKFSQSDKFNRDYKNDSEKPSSNYLKFLEVDEEVKKDLFILKRELEKKIIFKRLYYLNRKFYPEKQIKKLLTNLKHLSII